MACAALAEPTFNITALLESLSHSVAFPVRGRNACSECLEQRRFRAYVGLSSLVRSWRRRRPTRCADRLLGAQIFDEAL